MTAERPPAAPDPAMIPTHGTAGDPPDRPGRARPVAPLKAGPAAPHPAPERAPGMVGTTHDPNSITTGSDQEPDDAYPPPGTDASRR